LHGDVVAVGEIANGCVTVGQTGDDVASGRVGEGRKDLGERVVDLCE
jgi:hypothetical protein